MTLLSMVVDADVDQFAEGPLDANRCAPRQRARHCPEWAGSLRCLFPEPSATMPKSREFTGTLSP